MEKSIFFVQLVLSILQTAIRVFSFVFYNEFGISYPSLFLIILITIVDIIGHINNLVFEINRRNPSKTVLITGCDTGFGRDIAIQMAGQGWKVFAGCLTKDGISTLQNKNHSIVAIQMDVTKSDDIERVVKFVTEQVKDVGLGGLINNAGIANGFVPTELLSDNEFRRIFDVNYFGLVMVTRAFLPLIRAGKGRIVNISSIAAALHGRNMNPYNSAKAAVTAFSNTLRLELRQWQIPVVEIRPWFMKTMIVDADRNEKMFFDSLSKAREDFVKEYGYEKNSYNWRKILFLQRNVTSLSGEPQLVIDVLIDALKKRVPKLRYHVSVPWYVYLIYTVLSLTLHDQINEFIIDTVFGRQIASFNPPNIEKRKDQ
jgi:NAD(P)-dependent dehydrogenase (short-subunit alcohol dehydrogenase family)